MWSLVFCHSKLDVKPLHLLPSLACSLILSLLSESLNLHSGISACVWGKCFIHHDSCITNYTQNLPYQSALHIPVHEWSFHNHTYADSRGYTHSHRGDPAIKLINIQDQYTHTVISPKFHHSHLANFNHYITFPSELHISGPEVGIMCMINFCTGVQPSRYGVICHNKEVKKADSKNLK